MYTSIELTTYVYRTIISHLVDFEEQRDEIVNGLYSEPSAIRDDFSCFLNTYLIKLEELIKAAQIADKPTREKLKHLNYLPYVIIGSTVELEDANGLNTQSFKIVCPYDNSNSNKDLSYISSLGRALMLKKPGDVITAEVNRTNHTYKIKSIRYEL